MEQKPSSLKVNAYWAGSLSALLIFFFLSLFLAPIIMGISLYLGIGKVILLVFGCCGTVIGINLLIKQSKVGGSLSALIRISLGALLGSTTVKRGQFAHC